MRMVYLLLLLLSFIGCRSVEVVEKPMIVTQREYRDRLRVDSIHLHDSVYVQRLNDTVYLERFSTEYRYKLRVDTFIQVDSIPTPYAVVERVNFLTRWQRGVQMLGYVAIGFILLGVVLLIIKLR